jgi:hypothetical protein
MKEENCKEVRQTIEETGPELQAGPSMMNHLRQCNECLELFEQDKKLRQLLGSLSVVEAPADFDFRLRARIAHERSHSRSSFLLPGNLSVGIPAVTFVGLALMAGLFLLWPRLRSTQEIAPVALVPSVQTQVAETLPRQESDPENFREKKDNNIRSASASRGSNFVSRKPVVAYKKPVVTDVKDSSVIGAMVLKQQNAVSDPPISLSFPVQTLTVSVDDGSGVSRTISFPSVSFGSQRVLTNARSGLSPSVKGVW